MTSPATVDLVARRALGGFVFIDALTGSSISAPMAATCSQLALQMNRSGVYAILNGPGFNALTTEFIPNAATWPAPQTFEVTVHDPSRRYLSRRANIQAPQSLTGGFAPQQVQLYPGPASPVAPNWAVVRASILGNSGNGLPFAVVQVLKSDNSVAATGVADARGEVLLAVIGLGIQVSSTATDPVTDSTTPVTIKAYFDPGNLTQATGWIPNPDEVLGNLANTALKTGTQTGALGARQTLYTQVTISV